MNKRAGWLAGLGLLIGCLGANAQSPIQVSSQVRGNISYQRFKTNGSKIQMIRLEVDRSKPRVKSTYDVMVPIVTKDGTEYRKETRTRMLPVFQEKIVEAPANYVFRDVNGKEISRKEMIGKLGMGNGRILISLLPNQKIPPVYRQLFNAQTIFFQLDPTKPLKKQSEKK